ncbi:MAG: FIST C-terminal domain-containing protein [Magnetospirillum gryphiswaldense]|nr:FIST C-terminal domain-containing protein [Magnetospirillum gryphiswaldense]
MKVGQISVSHIDDASLAPLTGNPCDLVLLFAAIDLLRDPASFAALRRAFPTSILAGCSTAGEITGKGMSDGTASITTLSFDTVRVRSSTCRLERMDDSAVVGAQLGQALKAPDLRAALVFGKGVDINGSALIDGMVGAMGADVPISGGLAGDGGAFQGTLTLTSEGVDADQVVAVGLYGDHLKASHGSFGGWQPFGPPRKVTKADGNILYELDGHSALALYKDYLGEYARNLPASGLLFPFEMLDSECRSVGLIRTILGVDEQAGALVLAGDIDLNGHLRLMHANNEGLVDGAEIAARRAKDEAGGATADSLAILVSCVGRKLVMGDAVDEEVEAVSQVLGRHVPLTGFYSYGEIAPFSTTTQCMLHNQTMTVTFLTEA